MDALGDAFGFSVAEAVFNHGMAVGGVEFADGVFDAGDLDGGDAEFLDAEADEEGGEADVAGHFSADAGPDAVLVGCGGDAFHEADESGVAGLIEAGDAFISAVHGDGVLDEVVGADAEEIDFAGEGIGHDGGGGDFDHAADFEFAVEGDAFCDEFEFAVFEEAAGGAEF